MINKKNVFKLILITAIIPILGFAASCTVGDDTPPNQITDFRISDNAKNFEWTAPGDDGDEGQGHSLSVEILYGAAGCGYSGSSKSKWCPVCTDSNSRSG